MCRVRFGLTDIHFEECRSSLPQKSYYRPLVATIPHVVEKKLETPLSGSVVKELRGKANVVGVKESEGRNPGDRGAKGSARSSSSSSSTQSDKISSRRTGQRVRAQQSALGIQRPGASSSISPLSSDEAYRRESASKIRKQRATTPALFSKPGSPTKTDRKEACDKPSTLKSSKKPGKDPSTKRVRFAMDVEDAVIPDDAASDISSWHSSDDSYIDPPPPIEPFNTFSAFYRAPGASRTQGNKGNTASALGQWPQEDKLGPDWFIGSEEGSDVDVQGLPVKDNALKFTKYDENRPQPGRTQRSNVKISLAPTKESDESNGGLVWGLDSELGSNVDYGGQRPTESRFHRKQSAMLRRSDERSKLRSCKKASQRISVKPKLMADGENDRSPIFERHHTPKRTKKKTYTHQAPLVVSQDVEV